MDFYKRAQELKGETIAHRRYLHKNAEVGLELHRTKAYVMQQLRATGIEPQECGHGVTALIGSGSPVLLLRADMDALPMEELSGEEFACPTGTEAHTCGHDFHVAMLLTAAKMLKEREGELMGTVKLMFQPGEETFEGCKDMVAGGLLENPTVDAALGFHVTPGKFLPGVVLYNAREAVMNSVNGFRIEIAGKGGHGAYPHLSIDPIQIAVQIYLALEELIAREANPRKTCVLTIGKLWAGIAPNIIPDTAEMEGTLRTNDPKMRALLVRRIGEVVQGIAATYGGSAKLTFIYDVPPLICGREQTEEMASYMQELGVPGMRMVSHMQSNASEDFSVIAERIPSTYMFISAGFDDERGLYAGHNPHVRFNEDVCPIGAAAYAHCAMRWLEKHGRQ